MAGGVVRASARSNFYLWQVHRIRQHTILSCNRSCLYCHLSQGNFSTQPLSLDCYYSTNEKQLTQLTQPTQLNTIHTTFATQCKLKHLKQVFSHLEHTTSPNVLVIDVVIPCCKNIPRVDNQLTVHGVESLQFSHELDGEAPDSTCGQFGFPFAIIFHSGCP